MRLSIIMPAYKVDGYIEKCIRSIENKDLSMDDFEIIVINDGSPDRCREIVEKLQREFPNIILINQENQGVSMARNNGIAIAKGNYILPIDPDDYVLPNTLHRALDLAEQNQLDVLYLGFEIFDASGKSIWLTDYSKQAGEIYNGVEGYFASRGVDVHDPDRSWAILYRKEMLKQFEIKYPKDVPYLEDGVFLAKVFSVANKVMFCDSIFYQRTTRMGSATNSTLLFSQTAIQGFIHAIEDIKSFGSQNRFHQNQNLLINHVVAKFTLLPLTSFISQKNLRNYYAFIKILKEKNFNNINLEGLRFDYARMASIYNKNAFLFYFYHPINIKLKKYIK